MQGAAVTAGEMLAPGNGDCLHHHARTEQTTPSELRRPQEPDPVVCASLYRAVHGASWGARGDGIASASPLTAKGNLYFHCLPSASRVPVVRYKSSDSRLAAGTPL